MIMLSANWILTLWGNKIMTIWHYVVQILGQSRNIKRQKRSENWSIYSL